MPEGMMVRLYLDTGEPDAATSCKSGSEGGGWKSTHWVTRRPPTLLDGVFFLDLPDAQQRQSIWRIYVAKYGFEPSQALPKDEGWTGAEIKACCRLAALLDVPLVAAAQNIVPVSRTSAESVEKLRTWASGRCLSADKTGIYQGATVTTTGARRKVTRDSSQN